MRIPTVLRSDFYATASLLGGIVFVLLWKLVPGITYLGRFWIISALVLLIRLVAMRFKFHLPASHSVHDSKRWHLRHPRRRLPKE
jgi:uncharacterized membrane protein YeiH